MGVLLYSPEVQIIVTCDSGTYDISGDIISGSVTLSENQSHQMTCTLLNKGRRYDRLFKPNDRFVVYMKRLSKLLIMTGYLDTVPFYSVWPKSVNIAGSSSLKVLQYRFWDPNTAAATALFNSLGFDQTTGAALRSDDLVQSVAINLLTQVGGWDPSKIHFSALPSGWLTKISALYDSVAPALGLSITSLSPVANLGGNNAFTAGITQAGLIFDSNAPQGAALPSNFGSAAAYQGSQEIKPASTFYCQMPWGYRNADGSQPGNISTTGVKQFLAGQKLMVASPDSNVSVIVDIAGWGPPPPGNGIIGLSPDALAYLQITPASSNNGTNQVQIAWVTNPSQIPSGVYNPQAANKINVPAAIAIANPIAGTPTQYNNPAGTTTASPQALVASKYVQAAASANVPYVYGGTTPKGYDCSGLCFAAWLAAGAQIPRTSEAQFAGLASVPADQSSWLEGDLIFYGGNGYDGSLTSPGHVKFYIGDGLTVEAPYTGKNVFLSAVDRGPGYAGTRRITSANSTAITPTSTDSSTSGVAPASPALTADGSLSSFVSVWSWLAQSPNPLDTQLSGTPKALMLDTPLLPTIQTVVNSSMRSFCSAPNGDFIAWYPDYFNVYGTLGVVQLQPIEIQDFVVNWSDMGMITHQFTAGTYNPTSMQGLSGLTGVVQDYNKIYTGGVATIDFPQILEATLNVSPTDPTFSPEAIYARFGARPDFKAMGTLYGSVAEFWYAVYLFQFNWANQFAANMPISFMPEIYPGMIVQIPTNGVEAVGFQAYVQQVQHTWDLQDGAGFSTNLTITAPSSTSNAGLYGFAQGSQGTV